MFRTTIIAFRLGDHTLIRTIPTNLICTSRSIFIFFDTTNGVIELLIIMTNISKWISIVNVYSFFHICQIVHCWCLTFYFIFADPLIWIMRSRHLFMISFAFNPSKSFHSKNSRMSFQMPNTKNARRKSRKLGIASHKRHFLSLCIR